MLDESIIIKCIEGDRVAQESLYTFYSPRMKGICLRYARSVFEAEDIFQEAFIKVFHHLKNFRMQGSFDGWIRRIVINVAIDHYKKNSIPGHQVQFETLAEMEVPSVPMPGDLEEEDLLNLLNKLPEGYKVVFNLYAIEGYSHKEIAELLQVTEGTSKSQLSKARKYIQYLLQQHSLKENGTRTF